MKTERAWHFLHADGRLRNGRVPPPDGEWLVHEGAVALCISGLHASTKARDALFYAPGPIACLVEVAGVCGRDSDKLVCTRRRILSRIDATSALREFARWCARSVLHLWDAPEVVRRYLETGDESIRAKARDVAWGATEITVLDWNTTGVAIEAAAWAAAWDDAAWAAARGTAGAAAWAAAGGADVWDAQNEELERMLLEAMHSREKNSED